MAASTSAYRPHKIEELLIKEGVVGKAVELDPCFTPEDMYRHACGVLEMAEKTKDIPGVVFPKDELRECMEIKKAYEKCQ